MKHQRYATNELLGTDSTIEKTVQFIYLTDMMKANSTMFFIFFMEPVEMTNIGSKEKGMEM